MEVVTLIQGDETSSLTPLFMMHAISGVALPFVHLETLSEDGSRPVYGITNPLHCAGGEDFKYPNSLGDLAAYYLRQIKQVQPEGPYLIGGWSMGGMVAMFMAQILEAQGEEVSRIIMIDAANPEVFPQFANAYEHKEFSRTTYERNVAFGLQNDTESCPSSPIPTPVISEYDVEDYLTARGRRMSAWGVLPLLGTPGSPSSSESSASSSTSSLFDAGSPFTASISPGSEACTSIDSDSDCDSLCDGDFDDEFEPPHVKDFLRSMKVHIHRGLGLIGAVKKGDLFTPGKKSNFDVSLIKCTTPPLSAELDKSGNKNMDFIHDVMQQPDMMWNPEQFRSFESIPFSGEHDAAFQPHFVGELSAILRECLEDMD